MSKSVAGILVIVAVLVVIGFYPSQLKAAVAPILGLDFSTDDNIEADAYTVEDYLDDLMEKYQSCGLKNTEPCYCDFIEHDKMIVDNLEFTPTQIKAKVGEREFTRDIGEGGIVMKYNFRDFLACNLNPNNIETCAITRQEENMGLDCNFESLIDDLFGINEFDIESFALVSNNNQRSLFQLSNSWWSVDCTSIDDFEINNNKLSKCVPMDDLFKEELRKFDDFVQHYTDCVSIAKDIETQRKCVPDRIISLMDDFKIKYSKSDHKFKLTYKDTNIIRVSRQMTSVASGQAPGEGTPNFCVLDANLNPQPERDFTLNNNVKTYLFMQPDGKVCVYQGQIQQEETRFDIRVVETITLAFLPHIDASKIVPVDAEGAGCSGAVPNCISSFTVDVTYEGASVEDEIVSTKIEFKVRDDDLVLLPSGLGKQNINLYIRQGTNWKIAPTTLNEVSGIYTARFDSFADEFAVGAEDLPDVFLSQTTRQLEAERMYTPNIIHSSQQYGVDQYLVRAIAHQESKWDKEAVSYVGAAGLMQMMPATAKGYGLLVPDYGTEEITIGQGDAQREITTSRCRSANKVACNFDSTVDERFNAFKEIDAAVRYLAHIESYLRNNNIDPTLENVAAGYNAGEGAVKKYGGVPPYSETQDYVEKVSGYYEQLTSGQSEAVS